ncbi:caffeic acid 3-O-methyltransferase [Beta vulgaris subsp. vulgaris]|uniref:caffeic acid 3-O-methyltransferase n=1 Tax=Beta vulgaris subsp. vulgaris TaxID=3555 RepID=UPI002036B55D|nr:caffeic acid 3-O-methyltransferase [Beta vulgaris subsp. vulgaris]
MGSVADNVEEISPYWDLSEQEEEEASCFALSLMTDGIKFGVIKVVTELNVLEIIKKVGPGAKLSAAEIAAELPTDNPDTAAATLGRLLDYLVSYSILTVSSTTLSEERVERRYGLAPVCKFYTSNIDGASFASFSNTFMYNVIKETGLCLKDAVLYGKQPFTEAYGMSMYEYMGKNAECCNSFHKAMSDHSTLVMSKLLRTYNGFKGLSSLIDVGGGNGASLNTILTQYPTIKGINFDQPHVIADAPSYTGVEHVGGDMFVNIPKGDAIFLKWILHCFSDEACIKILKNCYAALTEDHGKVIVCEYLLPHLHETSNNMAAKSVVQFDVIMMVSGGKERTEKELKALAFAAGFQGFQVVCSTYNVKIMELLKKN